MLIDLFDIFIFKTGLSGYMDPWLIVITRYGFALPAALLVTIGLSRITLLAWTIGLGPNPMEMRRNALQAKVA